MRAGGTIMMKRLVTQFCAAVVVVFLLFGPHLAEILRGKQAHWFIWQPGDALRLIGLMATLAIMGVVAREGLRRLGLPVLPQLYDHLFVIAAGAGVLANLWFHTQRPHGYHMGQFGMEMQTAWLLLVAVTAFSFARPGSTLPRRCGQGCLILAPAVAIVAVQLIRLPTLAQPQDDLAPPPAPTMQQVSDSDAGRPTSVYLFIFDEWSYERTYPQGKLLTALPHLGEFASCATTFTDAHSPGPETVASIPCILRQVHAAPATEGFTGGFEIDGQFTPASRFPSIFTATGDRPYHKVLLQFGFALNLWLDGELDACRSYPWYPHGDNPIAYATIALHQAMFYWTDPWGVMIHEKTRGRVKDAAIRQIYSGIEQDALRVLRDWPANTFAVIHYPLPHHPYIVEPDGTYRGPNSAAWDKSNLEGYIRNLARMDQLIGEFMATLREAGTFDEAIIILTSDHSWRNDPALPQAPSLDQLTHVPLLVKLPGQAQPSAVADRFETYHLGEIIHAALIARRDPRQASPANTWPTLLPPAHPAENLALR